jgi:hypothetical protein
MSYQCHRCKREIVEGGLYYHVILTVLSGFDGFLDMDGDSDREDLLDKIKDASSDELERGVYFEEEVVLCVLCKDEITNLFLSAVDGSPPSLDGDPKERLH